MEEISTYLHKLLPIIYAAYTPPIMLGILIIILIIIILIITGVLSRRRISKLKLSEKALTKYVNCGINKDGKPILR